MSNDSQVVRTSSQPSKITDNHIKQDIIKAGLLGKFFGSNEHLPIYVAATVLILCLISGLFITVFCEEQKIGIGKNGVWQILSPFITSALGYIYGKKILKLYKILKSKKAKITV